MDVMQPRGMTPVQDGKVMCFSCFVSGLSALAVCMKEVILEGSGRGRLHAAQEDAGDRR